jgi:hypothetical protein
MPGDIEVQDPAASMFDDEQAVKQLEGHGGHREEVERNDHFTVGLQKSQPLLRRITTAKYTPQVSSHGSLGHGKAQLVDSPWIPPHPNPGSLPPYAG